MKAVLRLATVFTLVSVLNVARAADVSGSWKGAFDFQGSQFRSRSISGATSKITGRVEGSHHAGRDSRRRWLAGDTVTFWVNSDYQGQTYKLVYKGKIAADQIVFDFGTEDGSWSSPLTVKKDAAEASAAPPSRPQRRRFRSTAAVPESASSPAAPREDRGCNGDWKGSFDLNGSPGPITFHLKNGGPAVSGTIEGMGSKPIEVKRARSRAIPSPSG